jgi:hypothetical protein
MRVVYNDYLTEEMEAAFKAEKTVYLSSDGKTWLFTDKDVFYEMDKKFQFQDKIDTYPIDLETYIDNQYEEMNLNYFGFDICVADYGEMVLEIIDTGNLDIYCDGWDEKIDEQIKSAALDGLKFEMEDVFMEMIDDGYDVEQFKDMVSNALYRRDRK